MRRGIATLILVTVYGLVGAAQTPIVRARLEPATGIIVGQPVRFVVEILVPNYFTGSPEFPEFEIENAIVVLPQERAQNTNEQVNGTTYAGIIETYSLYPQQPGDFQIPPAQLTVPYASTPAKTITVRVSLPTLTFHAELPADAQGLDYFLPTTHLTMQQKWSESLKDLRAGDTIERTIVITAAKMQAMLIPPLPMNAPDGLRVYAGEPVVQDQKTDRGDFLFGRRTQSEKYFIQKGGDYTLPAIELKWWDLSTKRIVTTVLSATHFVATANPELVAELPPEPEQLPAAQHISSSPWNRYRLWAQRILLSACVMAAVFWICWRYFPHLYRYLKARHEKRAHAEGTYFRQLVSACMRDDKVQSYILLLRWKTRFDPNSQASGSLKNSEDSHLSAEINRLGAMLFSTSVGQSEWDGKKLAACLRKYRNDCLSFTTKRQDISELNP